MAINKYKLNGEKLQVQVESVGGVFQAQATYGEKRGAIIRDVDAKRAEGRAVAHAILPRDHGYDTNYYAWSDSYSVTNYTLGHHLSARGGEGFQPKWGNNPGPETIMLSVLILAIETRMCNKNRMSRRELTMSDTFAAPLRKLMAHLSPV